MNYRSNIAVVCIVGFLFITNGCNSSKIGPPTKTSKVTLDSFDKINEGMTKEQVTAMLGKSHIKMTSERGQPNIGLSGVMVDQYVVWTDNSTGVRRLFRIGFNDGKVVVVLYKDGKISKRKPELPPDSLP